MPDGRFFFFLHVWTPVSQTYGGKLRWLVSVLSRNAALPLFVLRRSISHRKLASSARGAYRARMPTDGVTTRRQPLVF